MAYDQVMTITRSGILWLIDFEEDASLKLTTSHISTKKINSVILFFNDKLIIQIKYIVEENSNFDNG